MTENCANCKHLKTYWKFSCIKTETTNRRVKDYDNCCDALIGENIVMQLEDIESNICECFEKGGAK